MCAQPATRPWSSATVLATVYAALVLYASLYPFEGWRWPPGQSLAALLVLPQSRYHSDFDLISNLLGYLPLGLLVAIAGRRSGVRQRSAWLLSAVFGVALSYVCEVAQNLVPGRVPSLEDWAMNSGGVSLGAVLALLLHRSGWVDHWQEFRQRWFAGDAAIALALLALWPVGLLFPTPVLLGLGQVVERLRELGAAGLADVPWAATVQTLLAAPPPASTTLRPLAEVLLIALGLLAPCLVAYSVAAAGWRRLALALGVLVAGCASMALSTLLNFGPRHALAWVTPQAAQGLALGLLLALLALPLRRRMAAGVGLVVLTGLVLGVAQAGDDPYFAESLHAWEQGRFVRFHGLAQWVGWLWPYAAMLWLLSRLGSGDRPRAGSP